METQDEDLVAWDELTEMDEAEFRRAQRYLRAHPALRTEVKGGKPNPGTPKDKRLADNRPSGGKAPKGGKKS